MDSTMMTVILWVAAAAVLGLYMMRRRGRKNKAFK